MKETVVAILVCSLALTLRMQGQDEGIAGKIKQLQQDQINAQMKNDASWAQEHLAEGFISGHSWGKWETKAELVKSWQNKANKWTSGNISDVHVATFGSTTAIAHYTFTYDAMFNGTKRGSSGNLQRHLGQRLRHMEVGCKPLLGVTGEISGKRQRTTHAHHYARSLRIGRSAGNG